VTQFRNFEGQVGRRSHLRWHCNNLPSLAKEHNRGGGGGGGDDLGEDGELRVEDLPAVAEVQEELARPAPPKQRERC
jgi:hypothetical protein